MVMIPSPNQVLMKVDVYKCMHEYTLINMGFLVITSFHGWYWIWQLDMIVGDVFQWHCGIHKAMLQEKRIQTGRWVQAEECRNVRLLVSWGYQEYDETPHRNDAICEGLVKLPNHFWRNYIGITLPTFHSSSCAKWGSAWLSGPPSNFGEPSAEMSKSHGTQTGPVGVSLDHLSELLFMEPFLPYTMQDCWFGAFPWNEAWVCVPRNLIWREWALSFRKPFRYLVPMRENHFDCVAWNLLGHNSPIFRQQTVCVCAILTSTNNQKQKLKHKAGLRHELVWVHNHLISRDWPSSNRASKQKQSKSKVKCRTTISITQRGLHSKLTDINWPHASLPIIG